MADANETNEESGADGAARSDRSDEAREREERLAELTDQSLDLLDQLAEARRRVTGLEDAVHEADERRTRLEGLLVDVRRRVRTTRSLRGLGAATADAPPTEVALWSLDETFDVEWLATATAALAGYAVTVLARPHQGGDGPAPFDLDERVRVMRADGTSPAHFANLALATTEAPLVLLVLAGTDVAAIVEALARGAFAAIGDEAVAIGQPALVHADASESLGLEASADLRVTRRSLDADESAPVALDFVAPEVVVVRRAAFERIGPFDEDLIGVHAFVDFSLRARELDFRVAGLPDVKVAVSTSAELPERARVLSRDRLVTMAQHRPGEVGAALGASELYWKLDPPELTTLLGALLRRLPGAAEWPEAVDLLVAEGVGLAGRTISGPSLDERLSEMERLLDELRAVPGEEPPTEEVAARLAEANEATGSDPASRLHRAHRLLEAEHGAKEALARALEEARAYADKLERDATQMFARELEATRERGRAAEEQARHHEAEAQQAKERAFALHEQVAEERARLRAAREELEREREDRQNEEVRTATARREELDHIAAALGLDRGTEPGEVCRHAGLVHRTLQDRERWIVELLHGVAGRVLGRKLRPHERAFLEERGAAP